MFEISSVTHVKIGAKAGRMEIILAIDRTLGTTSSLSLHGGEVLHSWW